MRIYLICPRLVLLMMVWYINVILFVCRTISTYDNCLKTAVQKEKTSLGGLRKTSTTATAREFERRKIPDPGCLSGRGGQSGNPAFVCILRKQFGELCGYEWA